MSCCDDCSRGEPCVELPVVPPRGPNRKQIEVIVPLEDNYQITLEGFKDLKNREVVFTRLCKANCLSGDLVDYKVVVWMKQDEIRFSVYHDCLPMDKILFTVRVTPEGLVVLDNMAFHDFKSILLVIEYDEGPEHAPVPPEC